MLFSTALLGWSAVQGLESGAGLGWGWGSGVGEAGRRLPAVPRRCPARGAPAAPAPTPAPLPSPPPAPVYLNVTRFQLHSLSVCPTRT